MNKYDEIERIVNKMNNKDLAQHLEFIKRGHISDYNFTYEEDDCEAYMLHMIMNRVIKKLESEE